jgi:acetate kinase
MKILVINAGSSSIKYQLFDMPDQNVLSAGMLERIGEPESRLTHRWQMDGREQGIQIPCSVEEHHQGLMQIIEQFTATGVVASADDISAIGHRVVHGGEAFTRPVRIDEEVIGVIREMCRLAPLHNPANLEGILVARKLFPGVPQVAVFDTAFHQSMPEHAYRYALPERLYREQHVRRYGFHGSSHHYVSKRAAELLDIPLEEINLITMHLGNGCSLAAIQGGKSVDTSMGMTPLEGLIMGTRCGDLDPALHFYLMREAGLSGPELENLLNKQSGLKGICGASDMREIHALSDTGDQAAALALHMFAYRIKKYLGAYYAVLGRVNAIVFTGGIGEHDARIREHICSGLDGLGIQVDSERNESDLFVSGDFSLKDSRVRLLVIPTDEELEIATSTAALLDHSC